MCTIKIKKTHNDTNIPSTLLGNQTQILRLHGTKSKGEGMGWGEKFEHFMFHFQLI